MSKSSRDWSLAETSFLTAGGEEVKEGLGDKGGQRTAFCLMEQVSEVSPHNTNKDNDQVKDSRPQVRYPSTSITGRYWIRAKS